jgi:hypothetical protein
MSEAANERIFTISDFITDDAARLVVRTCSDQDLVTLVEWIDAGKEFEPSFVRCAIPALPSGWSGPAFILTHNLPYVMNEVDENHP